MSNNDDKFAITNDLLAWGQDDDPTAGLDPWLSADSRTAPAATDAPEQELLTADGDSNPWDAAERDSLSRSEGGAGGGEPPAPKRQLGRPIGMVGGAVLAGGLLVACIVGLHFLVSPSGSGRHDHASLSGQLAGAVVVRSPAATEPTPEHPKPAPRTNSNPGGISPPVHSRQSSPRQAQPVAIGQAEVVAPAPNAKSHHQHQRRHHKSKYQWGS